jgi:hypothetical protein
MVPVRLTGGEVSTGFRAQFYGTAFRWRSSHLTAVFCSQLYLLGITMAFHRHRFWLSLSNTTRHW